MGNGSILLRTISSLPGKWDFLKRMRAFWRDHRKIPMTLRGYEKSHLGKTTHLVLVLALKAVAGSWTNEVTVVTLCH
jgi:hypothetical protein